MKLVSVVEGQKPIILAQPHGGTYVPEAIGQRFNQTGTALADTDWHINMLYKNLVADITIVESHVHRYVIDANRGPSDESLYPGQNTTSLCPLTDFNGQSIYKHGQQPDEEEINYRQLTFHQPYHDALRFQIQRLKDTHESIIVYDCHSIRSVIPFLFDGTLPDFNIGSFNGQSCSPQIQQRVESICKQSNDFTHTVNGRFKGGWTTRHYGKPDEGIHAIQMELVQRTYMNESPPWDYCERKANKIRKPLKHILETLASDCV